MKSKLDPTTTPAEKYRQFQEGLHRVLSVSKDDLQKREKQYQEESAAKPRRGPKPRHQ